MKLGNYYMLMNEAILDGASGGANPPPADAPPAEGAAAAAATQLAEGLKGMYGEITPQFPEGLEDAIKLEPSVKPFVDKEGKLNYANLMKSYVNTKKQMGVDKVVLPTDKSTPEEVAAFWEKLGWAKEAEKYEVKKSENSKLDDTFLGDLKKFAHENKIPVSVAQKMVGFLESQVEATGTQEASMSANKINEGIAEIKKEYGNAYEYKIGLAHRFIKETVSEADRKVFSDPSIGSNPAIIRALVSMASKVYKEDGFGGTQMSSGALTPSEAQAKINSIMADKNGPYFNSRDARHVDVVKEMEQLFKWKSAGK